MGLGVALISIVGLSILAVPRAQPYHSDPQAFLIESRLQVAFAAALLLQALATWVLGMLAAGAGAQALDSDDTMPEALHQAQHDLIHPLIAVILIRLIFVGIIAAIVLLAFDPGRRFFPDIASLEWILVEQPALALAAAAAVALQLIGGPVLRMRYSTALGALAATLTREKQARLPAAFNARMAAGTVLNLSYIWGVGVIGLILLTLNDPNIDVSFVVSTSTIWPLPVDRSARAIVFGLATLIGLSVFTAGQIWLRVLFERLAILRKDRHAH
ncbi:MAG: hypothetical protein GYB64_12745 [Chloroflexi bacterium]|nr:hypothetical protein [Chloroflexota bacterium]